MTNIEHRPDDSITFIAGLTDQIALLELHYDHRYWNEELGYSAAIFPRTTVMRTRQIQDVLDRLEHAIRALEERMRKEA